MGTVSYSMKDAISVFFLCTVTPTIRLYRTFTGSTRRPGFITLRTTVFWHLLVYPYIKTIGSLTTKGPLGLRKWPLQAKILAGYRRRCRYCRGKRRLLCHRVQHQPTTSQVHIATPPHTASTNRMGIHESMHQHIWRGYALLDQLVLPWLSK